MGGMDIAVQMVEECVQRGDIALSRYWVVISEVLAHRRTRPR